MRWVGDDQNIINIFDMEQIYRHPSKGSAGMDQISIQLYSSHKMTEDVKAELTHHFTHKLPKPSGNRLLIIGPKVGTMIRLMEPYCDHIDAVSEEEYIPILDALFVNNQSVEYTFNREGYIGENHLIPKLQKGKCTFSVIEISKFKDNIKRDTHYDIILLQNVIVHPKINIIKQLMRLQHQVLITMIVPGKLVHPNLFELISGIQQNILHVFYNQTTHERAEYIRFLTGRRQEINIWEIFVWIKKDAPDPTVELNKVEAILQEEVKKNTVSAEMGQLVKGSALYETQTLTNQYLDFHFGQQEYFGVKNFPEVCAHRILDAAKSENIHGRVLDLGCAVGRTSVELASHFNEIIGLDYSHAFINAANKVLDEKYPDLKNKLKFIQGDACKLNPDLGKFDVIFAGNLVDRVYDPKEFLTQVTKFMTEKSILVLTSPYTWLEEYTNLEKWLGGRRIDGKDVTTYESLREVTAALGLKELKGAEDIRFVIKDNPWVYQYTNAQMTFWIRLQK